MIKLGDFGLAVQLEHTNSKRDTKCGTSWYMAPETYDGKTTLESDVWALGISLIELAEGKNPFSGYSDMQVSAAGEGYRVGDEDSELRRTAFSFKREVVCCVRGLCEQVFGEGCE